MFSRPLTTYFYTTPFQGYAEQVTGSAPVPIAGVILNVAGDSYITDGSAVSTVVATDQKPVTIIN